ncbi:MAG: 2Fe-2S iron-sulfur cluster-binding protein, partial [Anaerolineales bacterium]
MAKIYIDDKEYEVDPDQNLLHVALSLGLDLPYFCWHPAMGSVGSCRQCAVVQFKSEDDKTGKIIMACMT